MWNSNPLVVVRTPNGLPLTRPLITNIPDEPAHGVRCNDVYPLDVSLIVHMMHRFSTISRWMDASANHNADARPTGHSL